MRIVLETRFTSWRTSALAVTATSMIISICILAKNEAHNIARILQQLAAQSLLNGGDHQIEVIVAANGCTDDTAAQANGQRALLNALPGVSLVAHDLPFGGKSRTWNHAVHNLARNDTDLFVFVDADIELAAESVLAAMLDWLLAHGEAVAKTGRPTKDIARKARKSPLDRFSLAVSGKAGYSRAINGSLYMARAAALREIWLPDETPGEDGFLNAMVHTRGFSTQPDDNLVGQAEQPTHFFKAHSVRDYFAHERRMIAGTIINRWLFEHFWSLQPTSPVGVLIAEWNAKDPQWVQKIIEKNVATRWWLIPNDAIFMRFKGPAKVGWTRFLLRLPLSLAATALTIPPAIAANAALKRKGSAGMW